MRSGKHSKRAMWMALLACCALSTASCRRQPETSYFSEGDRVYIVEKRPDGRYEIVKATGAETPEELEELKEKAPQKAYLLTEERLMRLYEQAGRGRRR